MIYINIGSNLNSRNGDRLFNIHKTIELIEIEKIKIKKNLIFMKLLPIQMKRIQNF